MGDHEQSSLEEELLRSGDIDHEKLAELAKVLFVMNGWKPGPIPNSYMVLCTRPGEEWCVGQLWADQERPFRLFEDMRFSSPERAQAAAEELKGTSRA